MIASKFMDDVFYSNEYWAKIGGVSNSELNRLELEMLDRLAYNLFLGRDEYDAILSGLQQRYGQRNEGKGRRPVDHDSRPATLIQGINRIEISG